MRITALSENTAVGDGIVPQHGLSLYIETDHTRLLFDMGQNDLFLHNAEALQIDLTRVELAVISHGHYDHGGGLTAFLEANKTAPVYIRRDAFEPHYNGEKYIGLSPAMQHHPRMVFAEDIHPLAPGLTLYSGHRLPLHHPLSGGNLTVEREGQRIAEDFCHEQYLLAEEKGKRILISGCSHRGVLNILSHFEPDVLVGGFHLSALPCDEELTAIARRLAAYRTDYVTCHCTGTAQWEWMKTTLPRLRYLSAGQSLEI